MIEHKCIQCKKPTSKEDSKMFGKVKEIAFLCDNCNIRWIICYEIKKCKSCKNHPKCKGIVKSGTPPEYNFKCDDYVVKLGSECQ